MKYVLQLDFYKKTHKTLPLILYEDDYGAQIEFKTNLDLPEMEMFAMSSGWTGGITSKVMIRTPSGKRIVIEAEKTSDSTFISTITKQMTVEIGEYVYQLRTEAGNYIYTSPELTYEVRELVIQGGVEDAIVDFSVVDEIIVSSDSYTYVTQEGSYEKTEWVAYETIISASRMNKIEDELEKLNNVKANISHEHEGYMTEEGFLEASSNFATKTELSGKADNSTLQTHTANVDIHTSLVEKARWNSKSDFSGNYEDLIGLPNLITEEEVHQLTENKVDKVEGKGLSTNDFTTAEKQKLQGLANYEHPSTHPATIIVQTESYRFVSDVEKATWNAKSDFDSDYNSLNNKPFIPVNVSDLTNDSNYVNATQLATKVDKAEGKQLSTNDYTTAEKSKLESLFNYTHPSTHPANIIVQTPEYRFVTDVEKTVWTNKYTKDETDNKISQIVSGISWKESVETFNDIVTTYPNPVDGWTVNVRDTDITYRYTGSEWIGISANAIPLVTTEIDGKMSKLDKAKLNGIEANANNYSHPLSHEANMIIQNSSYRFVTDVEKAYWNAKSEFNGDYNSLSNKPFIPSKTSEITNDSNYVNSTQLATKVDKVDGKQLSTNDYTTTEKNKLAGLSNYTLPIATATILGGIKIGKNITITNGVISTHDQYIHPSTHNAEMIVETALKRFTSDSEIASKSDVGHAHPDIYYTRAEVDKKIFDAVTDGSVSLDGYLTEEKANETFATKTDVDTSLGGKVDKVNGKQLSTNDYTTSEKEKLAGLSNYTHPNSHLATIIIETPDYRFCSDAEKYTWNNKSNFSGSYLDLTNKPTIPTKTSELTNDSNYVNTTQLATKVDKVTGKGLSTNDYTTTEKNKLAGIAENANNYTHPDSHNASMIVQSASYRFVSDTEKATWNGKSNFSGSYNDLTNKPTIPSKTSELTNDSNYVNTTQLATKVDKVSGKDLSTNDYTTAEKTKLAGVATGANNYTHPSTHPATIITQTASYRFVTDVEKATWNAKSNFSGSYNDLTDKPNIDSKLNAIGGTATNLSVNGLTIDGYAITIEEA